MYVSPRFYPRAKTRRSLCARREAAWFAPAGGLMLLGPVALLGLAVFLSGWGSDSVAVAMQRPDPASPANAKSGRPEAVADWRPEDFHSAKVEADPKLLAAVTYLGDAFVGNEGAAELLIKLLAAEPRPAGAASQSPAGRSGRGGRGGRGRGSRGGRSRSSSSMLQVSPDVAQAIIASLGKNNTPPAREALVKLLKGEQASPLRQQDVVIEVIRVLAASASPVNEDLLYRLVTEPEKEVGVPAQDATADDPSSGGDTPRVSIDPEAMRQTVLTQLESTASSKLRERIATYLDDPQVPIEVAQPLEQFLGRDNPHNFAAQIVLYKNKHTEPATKQNLQTYFTKGNIQAVEHLLGIPDMTLLANASTTTSASSNRASRPSAGGRSPSGRPPVTGRPSRDASPSRTARPPRPGTSPTADRRSRYDRSTRLRAARGGNTSRRRPPPGRGFPRSGRSRSRATTASTYSAETYLEFARRFWTSEMVDTLVAEVKLTPQFDQASNLLTLLGTMPIESSRQAIAKIMKEHAQDGPRPWISAGLLGINTGDPGMLVLAKDAYHNNATRRTTRPNTGSRTPSTLRSRSSRSLPPNSRTRSSRTSRPLPSRGSRTARGGAATVNLPSTMDAQDRAWIMATESLVVELNRQLLAAATVRRSKAEAGKLGDEMASADMPLELHGGARVKSQYHVSWPEGIADKMGSSQVAPLDLHYVRIEQEDRPNRLVSHYRRFARKSEVRDLNSGGFWIDGLGVGIDPNSKISVDVRITKTGGNNLSDMEKQPVVVEILTVQIPDLK